jgi:tight adherence protein B
VNQMVDTDLNTLLLSLLVGGTMAGLVFALAYPYFSGDRQAEQRMASVTEARVKKSTTRSAADVAASRKKQVADSLRDIDARQRAKERINLRTRLQRAGLNAEPKSFWIASAISGVICTALVFFGMSNSSVMLPAAATAFFVGTFGLPRFVISKMIKRRQAKFIHELANSIDVIVRGVKSGLPLNECLQIIARESPEPLCSEFREVVEQQRVGVSLSEALERLVQRMPLPEVKFLTIVIAIQQQAGGNLSEALGNLSGVIRDRFRMAMKVQALASEAKTSAMVLASLPPGVTMMIWLSSPSYIMPLFNTSTGNIFIAVGLFWMGCGVMVMRKMINFKF